MTEHQEELTLDLKLADVFVGNVEPCEFCGYQTHYRYVSIEERSHHVVCLDCILVLSATIVKPTAMCSGARF